MAPRAVALSILYPPDGLRFEEELKQLRAYIPAEVVILVGGRGLAATPDLEAAGAMRLTNLTALYDYLQAVRSTDAPAKAALRTPKSRVRAIKPVKPVKVARSRAIARPKI